MTLVYLQGLTACGVAGGKGCQGGRGVVSSCGGGGGWGWGLGEQQQQQAAPVVWGSRSGGLSKEQQRKGNDKKKKNSFSFFSGFPVPECVEEVGSAISETPQLPTRWWKEVRRLRARHGKEKNFTLEGKDCQKSKSKRACREQPPGQRLLPFEPGPSVFKLQGSSSTSLSDSPRGSNALEPSASPRLASQRSAAAVITPRTVCVWPK
ncbi:hypothetical protein JZ751_023528 [Albula glossodonta]|uniref:Uncharacterized protein n=1 Tax=Albula glossodonta TaxID=121402 RepID=A0A8T2NIV4_9TELE|nr:hypothetical protein JZ751_023528 [Albula glossodonta]